MRINIDEYERIEVNETPLGGVEIIHVKDKEVKWTLLSKQEAIGFA